MRAIDADAFKEYITDACEDMKHLFNDGGAVAKLITESFCKDIDEQPTIQPEPHWIPVTERLPDKEERDYWICTDDGYQCQCKWTDDIGFGHHDMWRWLGKPQYSKVVAWMPLPEPYKGVTE